ncbi:c-type cytochrome [Adhaeribacter terreus]|uniref:C-type cytochrome n=1 Tax=Adhaeribacter terreus TaxID=529703 RepID=A0ABW0E8W0_9BACT
MNKFYKTGLQVSAILFSSVLMVACDINAQADRDMSNDPGSEYAPQMYNSIPYESLKQEEDNKYNPGGMNMRVPARNTIARGKMAFIDHSADSSNMDVMGAGLVNPVHSNAAVLEDGKILYTRMCAHCHGESGAGDGLVAPKFKGVANLTSAGIKVKSESHIYQVITKGKGRMMPHNTQVNPEERWKIAMYVKQVIQGEGAPAESVDQAGSADKTNASADVNSNESTNPVK